MAAAAAGGVYHNEWSQRDVPPGQSGGNTTDGRIPFKQQQAVASGSAGPLSKCSQWQKPQ